MCYEVQALNISKYQIIKYKVKLDINKQKHEVWLTGDFFKPVSNIYKAEVKKLA